MRGQRMNGGSAVICYLPAGSKKERLPTTPGVLRSRHFISLWIIGSLIAARLSVHPGQTPLRKCDRARFHCPLRLLSRVMAPRLSQSERETRPLWSNATVNIQSQYALKEKPSCNSRTDKMNHCVGCLFLGVCLLWIWKLIDWLSVFWRRTARATSSCSLHTFCVVPSRALLQGSERRNKPWTNKVLFFNL